MSGHVGKGEEPDRLKQKNHGWEYRGTSLGDIGDVYLRGRGKVPPGIFFPLPRGAHSRRAVSTRKDMFYPGTSMGRKGGCQMSYIWKLCKGSSYAK